MFKGLMDVLTMKSDGITRIWIQKVRKSPNLKKYNSLDEQQLLELNRDLYKNLGFWFSKDIDKNQVGAFFARLGKTRLKEGYPVSEISFSLLLAQRSVLEYLSQECVADNSMVLYQVLDLTRQVADFFFLGSYYMLKGYLEDAYLGLHNKESLSEEVLKKYLSDEFFFKDVDSSR